MRLPNADQAIIPQRKITEYLLSFTHRDGRSKAVFFAAFGFSAATWEILADSLLQHASSNEVADIEETPFGVSYTVEGRLATPDGRSPRVRVIWFLPTNETIPRLVTAYPLKGARP